MIGGDQVVLEKVVLEKNAPVVSGRAKPRAHYARNKLLGLLPLIISVVWRRESRRRSRFVCTRTLGSAKRKKNDRLWEVRAHLGRDPITAISGN